jgi:hypothetical protein
VGCVRFGQAQMNAVAYYYVHSHRQFPPPGVLMAYEAQDGERPAVRLLFDPNMPVPRTPPRKKASGGGSSSRGALEDWLQHDIEDYVATALSAPVQCTFEQFTNNVASQQPDWIRALWARYRAAQAPAVDDAEYARLKGKVAQLQKALEVKERALQQALQTAVHGLPSNTSACMSPGQGFIRPPAPIMCTPPAPRGSGSARRALPMSSPLLSPVMSHMLQHNAWSGELRKLGASEEEQTHAIALLREYKEGIRTMCLAHGAAASPDQARSWSLEKAALEVHRCMRRQQEALRSPAAGCGAGPSSRAAGRGQSLKA